MSAAAAFQKRTATFPLPKQPALLPGSEFLPFCEYYNESLKLFVDSMAGEKLSGTLRVMSKGIWIKHKCLRYDFPGGNTITLALNMDEDHPARLFRLSINYNQNISAKVFEHHENEDDIVRETLKTFYRFMPQADVNIIQKRLEALQSSKHVGRQPLAGTARRAHP